MSEIYFCDEPTSGMQAIVLSDSLIVLILRGGLDSGAALNVVRLLKRLCQSGRAILCTIHQPSSILFEQFDEVILLQHGGKTVYHGQGMQTICNRL